MIKKILAILLCLIPIISVKIQAEPGKSKSFFQLLIVDSQEGEPYKNIRLNMLEELAKLGYSENENLKIKYYSIGNFEGATKSIWRLEKKEKNHYDVIFVNGTVAAMGFKKIAFGDPENKFVFGGVTDPVGLGLIDNFFSPPKANFTGVCYPARVEDRFRFIKKVMPLAHKIGLVYADMPQSQSYKKWVDELLKQPEFKDLEVIFRKVEFVESEGGHIRMAWLAEKHIKELDSQVDLFISPNDQMGVQKPFAEMVYRLATKPLLGLGRNDVMEGWGATMSFYPSAKASGKQLANMIKLLLEGQSVKEIIPMWPQAGIAFDLSKAQRFKITIPKDLLKAAENNITH